MNLSLEKEIALIAADGGADLIGFTTVEILSDGPPSADPRYLLPEARSVVSFAVALDPEAIESFITKKTWKPHCENRKAVDQRVYRVGDAIADYLQSLGHAAVNVEVNNNYRPEEGADDVTEMTEFHPEFSLRYAALASGLGRLGWSGNLLTKQHGALVELGSVITSARLSPTPPIPDSEHPCDRCKMCSLVCPVSMIDSKESTTVTVAGITETISRKRPNTCCWIGCTGYEGLAVSGEWSNWSPYRLGAALPESKEELDALCVELQKKDPQMHGTSNAFADFRGSVFDPDWFYYTVCGFCRGVCWPRRSDRLENRKKIHESGKAALKLDGEHVVAGDDATELQTPFGLGVVVPKDELSGFPSEVPEWQGQFPLDREVIKYIAGGRIREKSSD